MICDMCGSEGNLFKAVVEGAELTICQKCSKFGKIIAPVKRQEEEKSTVKKLKEVEVIDVITEDYAEKIRKKREGLGLTQKEFAKKVNEKESIIHQLESGQFKPPIDLAKKLQKFLKIRLIEEYEENHGKPQKVKSESLTIGDFIKVKKK